MEIRTAIIPTIENLTNEIEVLIQEFNHRFLFRGHANSGWELLPSIKRTFTRREEKYFSNEFRVKARSRADNCPSNDDYPCWLELMQHYGLPTRLLDWSYSPLVAAYFASHPDYQEKQPSDSACIWCLAPRVLNSLQGFEPLIFPIDANSFAPLLTPAFKDRPETNQIGAAMAIETDQRIKMQQGAFTIHSSDSPLNYGTDADQFLYKLVIPRHVVPKLHDHLEILGINKSYLFPDMENLAKDIVSRYKST